MIRLKNNAVFVESSYSPGQLDPASQIDRDRESLFSGRIKEGVL